ncbi:MAG: cupin [Gammaproteobacteria bacterium]
MSALSIYNEDGTTIGKTLTDGAEITRVLGACGVQFERWQASAPLDAAAGQDEVLAAYRADVDALNRHYNFKSVDVVALTPDHPEKEALRGKFLAEHTHDDFEIRFFVDGKGLFYLHVDDRVYLVLCERGDLIAVPAHTTHWFDMGAAPAFKCIRLFTSEDGWIGNFTGSDIAARFPDFDTYRAGL